MRRTALTLLALSAGLAHAPARAESLGALLSEWSAAHGAGRAAPVGALYTPDARLWGEASPREGIGHADIARYFATFSFGPAPVRVRVEQQHVREMGAIALVSGRFTLIHEGWDGAMIEEPCRFTLAVARGADGRWRIAEEHVSRMPAP